MMCEPPFWETNGLAAHALQPLACLWTGASRLRMQAARPWRAPVPVLCIGNVTVGGAGKTPTALALTRELSARGRRPHILTRGYGGRLKGPVKVDQRGHSAREVGDEPLLLAHHAPVWVCADRVRSAACAVRDGAGILVMDDGLQNPGLGKDLSILVVDGPRGLGNRRVLPAGPLREPFGDALRRIRAVVIVGEDRHDLGDSLAGDGRIVLHARLKPDDVLDDGEPLYAFAGIARPGKFFATLKETGAVVVKTRSFPDHHRHDPMTVTAMLEEANALGARLVTTEKDWVRLDEATRPLAEPVRVHMVFRDPSALDRLIDGPELASQ